MVEKISDTNYCVTLDKTTYNGVLRFSKEISVWLCPVKRKEKCFFLSASAVTPGGWFTYDKSEFKDFDLDYPGVIDEATKELLEYMEVGYD